MIYDPPSFFVLFFCHRVFFETVIEPSSTFPTVCFLVLFFTHDLDFFPFDFSPPFDCVRLGGHTPDRRIQCLRHQKRHSYQGFPLSLPSGSPFDNSLCLSDGFPTFRGDALLSVVLLVNLFRPPLIYLPLPFVVVFLDMVDTALFIYFAGLSFRYVLAILGKTNDLRHQTSPFFLHS